jgi:hypothetical protein
MLSTIDLKTSQFTQEKFPQYPTARELNKVSLRHEGHIEQIVDSFYESTRNMKRKVHILTSYPSVNIEKIEGQYIVTFFSVINLILEELI